MVGSIKSINTARARARALEEEEEEKGEREACPCFLYWQQPPFQPVERSLFCKILYTASMERLRAEGREKGVM